MRNDAFSMTLLFDYYGDLLTEKQKTYFDLYYNQDFSLAEIAQEEGVSRQGVYDALTRTEAILRNFEEKTGFVAKAMERARLLEEICLQAEKIKTIPGGREAAEAIAAAAERIKE